ncbi:MAG: sulfite exporter TauE/SafE family protein [Pseudomonadota bacterium]
MDIAFILAGLAIGMIVGLSGVGGGALMTPFLVFYGVPVSMAVGTDLVYAALTKSGAVWLHHKARTVEWRIVGMLALGSIPASLAGILLLKGFLATDTNFEGVITSILGIALILSALVLLFKTRILQFKSNKRSHNPGFFRNRWTMPITILCGTILGLLVTLSSVGAGALGAAILILLYPRLPAASLVGTDLAHAVPLAALAGAGHAQLGLVDFQLLGNLLLGSLPGVFLGTKLGTRLAEPIVRGVLASLLLTLGVAFTV